MKTTQAEEEGATALLPKQAKRPRPSARVTKETRWGVGSPIADILPPLLTEPVSAEERQLLLDKLKFVLDANGDHYTHPDEDSPRTYITSVGGKKRSLGFFSHDKKFRVLRSYNVPFVDIDMNNGVDIPQRAKALQRVADYAKEHPEFGCRAYLTHSGIRLIVTSLLVSPHSKESFEMQESLDADPRYIALCVLRGHYAARLDPKPERCTLPVAAYAATQYLWHIGNETILEDAQALAAVHDVETSAHSGGPLA